MKPPQSLSFRSIYSRVRTKITQSYSSRLIYSRVCTKIAPYETHQPTLMSPWYSNATTSIRELIIRHASNNFTIIIFNPHKDLKGSETRTQSFYRRFKTKTCANPYAWIPKVTEPTSWSPKHTSSESTEYPIVTTGIPCKTYIKCSQILKDSIR